MTSRGLRCSLCTRTARYASQPQREGDEVGLAHTLLCDPTFRVDHVPAPSGRRRRETAAFQMTGRQPLVEAAHQDSMTREIRANGHLAPRDLRWVTATTAARVDALPQAPGSEYDTGDILLELTNPELQLSALEAQSECANAKTELARLAADVDMQSLQQRGAVADGEFDLRLAERELASTRAVFQHGAMTRDEVAATTERRDLTRSRLQRARQHLRLLRRARTAQVGAQQLRVTQLEAVAASRNERLAGLTVRAVAPGIVREQPVTIGQWVLPGTLLLKLVEGEQLRATLKVPEAAAKELAMEQAVRVDIGNQEVMGAVERIDPGVREGAVVVDVRLEEDPPAGARPDLSVSGTIELERIDAVLQIRRPAHARADSNGTLFRLEPNGSLATRVNCRFGRASANRIEILSGLQEGDLAVVSDMSGWSTYDHLRLE